MRQSLLWIAPAIVVSGACNGIDGRRPTGSQSIATSETFSALYVASVSEGSVSRVQNGQVSRIDVGQEPIRIARAKDRLFVSLRAERAVAVLRDKAGSLEVETKIPVGAEPFGVVASPDGSKVYVASSMQGTVSEIDAKTLDVTRSWNVDDQPRWLAIRPDGNTLYVASAFNGTISVIGLGSKSGSVFKLALRSLPINGIQSSQRVTGDPAVTPDGSRLILPALYADNTTTIDDPGSSTLMATQTPPSSSGGYQSAGATARLNPTMVVAAIGDDGNPDMANARTIHVIAQPASGYVSNITVSPDNQLALASIEGGAAVAVVEIDPENVRHPLNPSNVVNNAFSDGKEDPDLFQTRRSVAVQVGAGPRSAAFTDGGSAFVYSFIDRQVARISVEDADGMLGQTPATDGNGQTQFLMSATGPLEVAPNVLAADADHGRRLFYATNNPQMSGTGSGVSCATCHFEGRNDGLSWTFDRGPRQTPSLAGNVGASLPVRWEGDRPTVANDAFQTSQTLMGGMGLSTADAADIETFIDGGRDVDVPLKGSSDDRVARGKAIFESPQVGCSGCHSGSRFSNGRVVSLLGLDQVKVRPLVGILASPPYFHDGSSATLHDLVLRVRDGSMGDTSSLSDEELDELVLYLSSI
jgi:YVTN family beta-propeller protein